MSRGKLMYLRFWQYLWVNLFILFSLIFYFEVLFEITSFNYSLLSVGLFFLVRGLFHHQYTQLSLLIPTFRKLYSYEVSMLGLESYHLQKNRQYLLLIPAIIAIFFGILVPYKNIDFDILGLMKLFSPLLFIITNLSLMRHNKKVDTKDIHAYRSYHAERLLVSVLFGLLFFFVFSAVIVFATISLN